MKLVLTAARRWPASFGVPGAVALLALLASLPPLLLAPRWHAEAAEARRSATPRASLPASLPARTPQALASSAAASAPPSAALGPAATENAARVGRLLQLAQRQRVSVERTTQRLDSSSMAPRVQLGLSARGRYAELRAFVAAALQADAALSLDRLQLRRPSAEADALEADLQWSLWLAPHAGGSP